MRRGTVIPGALVIIIIFLVAISCIAFLIMQFNQYSTSTKLANVAASNRNKESLRVLGVFDQGGKIVQFNVTNIGPVPVLVVGYVKVNPSDKNPSFHNFTEGPYALQPLTSQIIPSNRISPPIPGDWSAGVYTSYGNVFWVNPPPMGGGETVPPGQPVYVTFAVEGIGSDASGTVLTVDGAGYPYDKLPKTFLWTSGETHSFSWASPVSGSSGKRYIWNSTRGLSDKQSDSAFTVNANGYIIATYKTQFSLTISVNPSSGGSTNPAPGTYWYNAGSSVQISATANSGYAFDAWTGSGLGSYSGIVNPATVTVNGPITETANFFSFSISVSPSSVSIGRGGSTSATVTVTYASGVNSKTISLSVSGLPSGASASFNPSSVTISPSSSTATSTMTITTSSSTPVGSYTITITGSGGGVSRSTTFTLNIFDFSVSVNPSTVTIGRGSSGSVTVTVTAASGSAGMPSVSLSASGLPSGASGSFSPSSGTPTFTSTYTISVSSSASLGSSTITISASGGGLTRTATFTLNIFDFSVSVNPSSGSAQQGGSVSATVTVSAVSGSAGMPSVSLSASGLPSGASASFNPSSGTPTFSSTMTITASSSTPVGSYTITITGSGGGVSRSTTFTLNIFDFSVSVSPTSISIGRGGSGSVAVTVSAVSGSAGMPSVSLSASGLPSGASGSFSPSSGTPTFTSTYTISVTSSATLGSSTITVTASGGGLTRTATFTLNIFDFSVSVSPSSGSAQQGGSVTATVTVSAVSGSAGTPSVSLSASGLPSGASTSFNPSSGTPTFSSIMTITTSSSTPTGTYTITITASGGGISRTTTYTLSVQTPVQLRELDYASSYDPDISFSTPSSGILEISSTYSSIGRGYVWFTLPKSMLNGMKLQIRWNVYYTYADSRDLSLATLYVFDVTFDRHDTSSYFKPNTDSEPILNYRNILATHYPGPLGASPGWLGWRTDTSSTLDLSSFSSSTVTVMIRLVDGWVGQAVKVDVDYVSILDASGNVVWTFNFDGSVSMEVTGTTNDYGLFTGS